MNKIFKFIYLNTYSFLLLFCGIISILVPFYKISKVLFIPQVIVFFIFFYYSVKLFSTYKDKLIKCDILLKKNKDEFRPETFKIFMQAPCGRLVTKSVLQDLNQKDKYKELLIYKEPFFVSVKNNFKPTKTSIYINEEFK
ncbi:MAG: hypothetical protein J6K22_01425 [Spirochaetaceae bacterium]|nr:hypothetical protein [Spirochaetaceae bacterium]